MPFSCCINLSLVPLQPVFSVNWIWGLEMWLDSALFVYLFTLGKISHSWCSVPLSSFNKNLVSDCRSFAGTTQGYSIRRCQLDSLIKFPIILSPDECSVQFSCSVVSDSLRPHGLQHTRPPCPSPTPGVYLNSCPLSLWCHPTTSSCHPLLLPSIFLSIKVFSSESALCIR